MPNFAESACRNIAIKLLSTITLSSVYPNFDPPPMSVAQFPGSMYPTATKYPGPANAHTLRSHEAPALKGTVRCASGSEGAAPRYRRPAPIEYSEVASEATDGSVSNRGGSVRAMDEVNRSKYAS